MEGGGKRSEKQGAGRSLWRGLCSETRWDSRRGLFSSPWDSSSGRTRGRSQSRALGLGTSVPGRACCSPHRPRRLQSSAVRPAQRNLRGLYPVTARIPNWRCSFSEAFEGRNNESFPCRKIDCPPPQCCFRNTDLFWGRRRHSIINSGFSVIRSLWKDPDELAFSWRAIYTAVILEAHVKWLLPHFFQIHGNTLETAHQSLGDDRFALLTKLPFVILQPRQPNPDWRYSASLRAGMHRYVFPSLFPSEEL